MIQLRSGCASVSEDHGIPTACMTACIETHHQGARIHRTSLWTDTLLVVKNVCRGRVRYKVHHDWVFFNSFSLNFLDLSGVVKLLFFRCQESCFST